MHVRQPKPASDQAAIAKQMAHVFRKRVGRDIEILGPNAEQQIADSAADQEALITSLFETVKDFKVR